MTNLQLQQGLLITLRKSARRCACADFVRGQEGTLEARVLAIHLTVPVPPVARAQDSKRSALEVTSNSKLALTCTRTVTPQRGQSTIPVLSSCMFVLALRRDLPLPSHAFLGVTSHHMVDAILGLAKHDRSTGI